MEVAEGKMSSIATLLTLLLLTLMGGYIKNFTKKTIPNIFIIIWCSAYIMFSIINVSLYQALDDLPERYDDTIKSYIDTLGWITIFIAHTSHLIIAYYFKDFIDKLSKLQDYKLSSCRIAILSFSLTGATTLSLLASVIGLGFMIQHPLAVVQKSTLFIQRLGSLHIFVYAAATLSILLHDFTEDFKAKMVDNRLEVSTGEFEGFRRRYEALAHLVLWVDKILSFPTGVNLLMDLLYNCFVMYIVFLDGVSSMDLMRYCWNFFISLGIYSIAGGILRYQARRPLDVLYEIEWREGKAAAAEVQVFLARLLTDDVGFTAVGLYKITFSTMINMVGLIVTYAIIVQQNIARPTEPGHPGQPPSNATVVY